MKNVLVIGSLNMDFVVNVDKAPLPGETIKAKSFDLIPGGKGANQTYALGCLGVSTSMIGAVGQDEYGIKLINNLKQANVNTKGIIKLKDANTGNAFITVDNSGQNSIITVGGANKRVNIELIDKNINLIKKADIIVMQLEIPMEVVLYVAKFAKSLGKFVVIDPAPAVANLPEELFRYVDIMKPNETELQTICGKTLETEKEFVDAAKDLINRGVKNVIVTLGANGSLLVNAEGVKKFAALKVLAVDTTAAGDCFTAGLIKGLVDGKSLEDSIKFGHAVSAIAVTRKGAQSSIPSIDEVKDILG